MPNDTATPTKFYRLPQVREICGSVAASTIWGWVKNHEATGFPLPVKLSQNCTAWNAADIEAWAQARIAASKGGAA